MTTGEVIALIKAFGGGGGGSSGGGALKVGVTVTESGDETTYTLDKTWQQIHDALLSGGAVLAKSDKDVNAISSVGYLPFASSYSVVIKSLTYETGSEDGYPSRIISSDGDS